ncbi:hypothetical protein CAI21_15450 [Alkalilimnicola ehrlichii]|nr:hypothetical protein CAI21_15450 [Alkalilimnicola ehrlichii]
MANGFGSAGPLRAGAAIGGGKKAHGAANLGEVKALQREYRRLKRALGDIVPRTLFVHTDVDGRPGVIALAEVAQPWFDLANPGNEEESLHLLQLWPDAGHQFTFFVRAATAWAAQDMMIDLTGDSNLVLDRSRAVRFIDSFRVFFYADMLYSTDAADSALEQRIDICRRRLAYLQRLAKRIR